MPTIVERNQLARLFRETGAAHHRAFAATAPEADWPAFYADWFLAV